MTVRLTGLFRSKRETRVLEGPAGTGVQYEVRKTGVNEASLMHVQRDGKTKRVVTIASLSYERSENETILIGSQGALIFEVRKERARNARGPEFALFVSRNGEEPEVVVDREETFF